MLLTGSAEPQSEATEMVIIGILMTLASMLELKQDICHVPVPMPE